MAPERRCNGTRDDGSPCGAPSNLVDPDSGFCPAHGPGGSEAMAELGRKGAEATARKLQSDGLSDDELPPLTSHEAAERWCDVVGRAVAQGRLGHNEGRTILRAVREWRDSRDQGELSDHLDALMDGLATWKKTGDAGPLLEVIDGGAD